MKQQATPNKDMVGFCMLMKQRELSLNTRIELVRSIGAAEHIDAKIIELTVLVQNSKTEEEILRKIKEV